MDIDRRRFAGSLGASILMASMSGCARASDAAWPGPATPAGTLPKLPIGMNLAGVSDWSTGFPFRNVMWGARPWMTRNAAGEGPWNTDRAHLFEYDDDGYPLEVPGAAVRVGAADQAVFTLLPNTLKPGRYVLYHDGEGEFSAFMGTRIISSAPGRVVLQMTHRPDVVEALVIRRSVRGNHVRNIRILAENDSPETLDSNPFLPEFLEFCRPFKALRFMDWGATNNSREQEWHHRRRPTFFTMASDSSNDGPPRSAGHAAYAMRFAGGVAFEVMIKLANLLKADPWFCIPHQASDDYIRQCAALFHAQLGADRKLYLEYSNEIWNWQFGQSHWMLASTFAADALTKAGLEPWTQQDGERKGANHPERIGALIGRAFGLWHAAWPEQDRKRAIRVCAVQAYWPEASVRTIDWCHDEDSIDAVSAAGYFGPTEEMYRQWERRGAALTADQVIADMKAVVRQQSLPTDDVFTIARRARDLGLPYVNYEGGQHIQPFEQRETAYMPALKAAQSHPGMYDVYVENLRLQKHLGSQLFCAFNSVSEQGTRWGSWGAKPSYATPNSASPKYRALIDCNV